MRIGAIFARGSCRALKWMALVGMVFALGAGLAVAQITIKGPTDDTVMEGGEAVYTVSIKGYIAPDASESTASVTLQTPVGAAGDDAVAGDASDYSTNFGLVYSVTVPAGPAGGDGVLGKAFNESGTIRIPIVHDPDAENERFTIDWTVAAGGLNTTNVASGGTTIEEADGSPSVLIIDDDEVQKYVLKQTDPDPGKANEGDMITVTLTADPEHTTPSGGSTQLAVHLDPNRPPFNSVISQGGTDLTGNLVTIGGETSNSSATITITTDDNDENRVDDTITLSVYSGTAGDDDLKGDLTIKLTDKNKLPAITAKAIALDDDGEALDDQPDTVSVMEGKMIDIEFTVRDEEGDSLEADEDLEISLVPTGSAGAQDYRLDPHPVKIDEDEKTATARLTANLDQDVGMETLVFTATVAGEDENGEMTEMITDILSVDIIDATMKLVEAKSDQEIQAVVYAAKDEGEGEDELFNPDETIGVDASMLFTAAEGVGVVYTATSDMPDVAGASTSGNIVTVTAGEPGGPAHITITATAQPPAGAKGLPQMSPNVAQAIFPVDVALEAVSIDVMAESEMIDEGMSTKVMANASRAVEEDTSVALEVVGPVDMMPEAIMIEAGMDSGYVELTATADDDTEGATITVVAIHSAIDGGSKTITITVSDTTEPPVETTYALEAAAGSVMEGDEVEINVTASQMVDADTTIDLVLGAGSADADDYTVETLVIEAGETTGGATLTAIDDSDVEGDETLTLNGMMGNVVVDSVMLTITDNDEAPVVEPTVTAKDNAAQMILDAVATAAGGADWMVGGMVATVDMADLFTAAEGGSIAYSGASSTEAVMAGTSGTMLMLTPMAEGVSTITVTASDSASMDVARVDADVAVALQTLSIGVAASADTVMEGESVTLTATANRAVTAETMLTVTVTGNMAAVEADAMITIAMGQMTGTGMVMAVEDDDSADAMVSVVVSGAGIAGGAASFDIAITDNDPTVTAKDAAVVQALFGAATAMAGGTGGWVPGGNAATVDMSELFTTNDSPTLEYMAESSAEDMVAASASGSTLTLTPMATGDATISVTATDTSGDMYDTAMVSATVMVGVLPLEIMVAPPTAEVEEGGMVEIMATANKMVDANVEVMLIRDAASSASEDDYSLEPALITIMAGEAMGKAMLTATDDYMVEGNESLSLVARVKDMGDIGSVMVSIMDNDMETTYTLSGPMDMNIVEGMSYELTATANQAVHMDTEVMLMRDRAASDAGDDDYSVGSIMIMAGEMSGTTMLMVTEDNMPDAGDGTNMGESLVLVGSVDGMEVGSLEFIIWDAAVPALPIIAQLLLAAFLAIGGYRRYLRR